VEKKEKREIGRSGRMRGGDVMKEEEARNGRKSLNTGTQGRKKLVVKSTPFHFHRPLGTRSLSLSFSLPQSLSLSLYSSAFLFFFDNIKRPLVAARAFIKSAPERKKASRALEGTAAFALSASQVSRVSCEISPADRSIARQKARARKENRSAAVGTPIRPFSFFFVPG